MPDLEFYVEGAAVAEYAAVPTLLFKLRIQDRQGDPIRFIALTTQIRIAARQRAYSPEEQARLRDVFGTPDRWSETLNSFLWTHVVYQVGPFTGETAVDLPVTCSYDFEVAGAKYLHGLQEGEIPLEFLFSGSVFYAGEHGLQVVQIPWEKEAQFRLPVRLWREMIDRYFPGSAWLRLRRDTFDRLGAYKAERGFLTWEAALDSLLDRAGERAEEGVRQ